MQDLSNGHSLPDSPEDSQRREVCSRFPHSLNELFCGRTIREWRESAFHTVDIIMYCSFYKPSTIYSHNKMSVNIQKSFYELLVIISRFGQTFLPN